MNNILILFIFLLTAGNAFPKYEILDGQIAIGDALKPEAGTEFAVQSTTSSSLPCPKMTEVQRDALATTPFGACVYNTTAASTEFWNGTSWIPAGSSAVLSAWLTGTAYGVGAFVYTTDFKLWIANTPHTAGATFPPDIANWDEASNDIDIIGSSTDNAIMRWDGVNGDIPQDSNVLVDDDGRVSTTGLSGSTYFGFDSGINDDLSANNNTGFGDNALELVSTGNNNSGFGWHTLDNLTTGINNTAIGNDSLQTVSTTSGNTAVGSGTLRSNFGSAGNNTAIGAQALRAATTGVENVAVGAGAMQLGTSISGNTAIGFEAMYADANGDDNVAIGHNAGYGVAGATYARNTLIGALAGDSIDDGTDNIIIGYDQDLPTKDTNNHMNIGGVLYGDLTNNWLGVNVVVPTVPFDVLGNSLFTGNVNITGTTTLNTGLTGYALLTAGVVSAQTGVPQADVLFDTADEINGPVTEFANAKLIYNHITSSGVTDGCAITDNGDGTIDIAAGVALLRASADPHSKIYHINVQAQAGIVLTDQAKNYVYYDYNAGAPTFVNSTSESSFNCIDKCLAFVIARDGTNLSVIDGKEQNVDGNRKTRRWMLHTQDYWHAQGGTLISETGTRNVGVTAGRFYFMLNEIQHAAFDTSVADTFTYHYKDGTGWTSTTSATQISKTQYNTVGTGLTNLTNNYYKTDWVYIVHGGTPSLHVVYSYGEYQKLSDAQAAGVPTDLPIFLSATGSIIGKIIHKENIDAAADVASVFTETFVSSTATTHNNLSGLQGGAADEYYHLPASENGFLVGVNQSLATTDDVDFNTVTTVADIIMSGTGQLNLASGTTAQRSGTPVVGMIRHNTSDSRFEGYNNGSWEALGGGGSGSGGINYLVDTDFDFEIDLGTWVSYDDGAATEPVDGTGGTPTNITFATTGSSLRGDSSASLTYAAAASAQGEGVSVDFTIDDADKAQVLRVQFDLKGNVSNYNDGDLRFFIYDVTNANLIRVTTGEDIKAKDGKHIATFQAASDSNSYRAIIHIATSAVGLTQVIYDNAIIGPSDLASGPAMSDAKSYTATLGNFGNATQDLEWAQVGENIRITGIVTIGSTLPTGTLEINLPSGVSAVDNKMFGTAVGRDGSAIQYTGAVRAIDADTFRISGPDGQSYWSATVPITWANTDTIYIDIKAKIVGWSSNQLSSQDVSGREVVTTLTMSGNQTISSASPTKVDFNTVSVDKTAAYNSGSTRIDIGETGTYVAKSRLNIGNAAAEAFTVRLMLNGSIEEIEQEYIQGTASYMNIESKPMQLTKGDYLEIYIDSAADTSYTAFSGFAEFSVWKESSPQEISQKAQEVARYTSNSGLPSITTSVWTDLVYEDLDHSTHGSGLYNTTTGDITPTTGKYYVEASVSLNYVSTPADQLGIRIQINGTDVANTSYEFQGTGTALHTVRVSGDFDVVTGDTIDVQVWQSSGASQTPFATGTYNTLSIHRIK